MVPRLLRLWLISLHEKSWLGCHLSRHLPIEVSLVHSLQNPADYANVMWLILQLRTTTHDSQQYQLSYTQKHLRS